MSSCRHKNKELLRYSWTKHQNLPPHQLGNFIIAELAERSPIIIQKSSNPWSRKNLDVQPYDRTTVRLYMVLLLTCVVNCTAGTPTPRLCPVVSALGSESDDPVSSPGRARRCALETWEKKMPAPPLGLAKSIYYINDGYHGHIYIYIYIWVYRINWRPRSL